MSSRQRLCFWHAHLLIRQPTPADCYNNISQRTARWAEEQMLRHAQPLVAIARFLTGPKLRWKGRSYVNLTFIPK